MKENQTFITNDGEIISKKELLAEIENLLNRFDSKNLQGSYLDSALIDALDINSLLSIRNQLLNADSRALKDFKDRLNERD